MRWLFVMTGSILFFASWAIVQVGKGVLFTQSEYEQWDDLFLSDYRACCFLIDLKTAAPFALVGFILLVLGAWKFKTKKGF